MNSEDATAQVERQNAYGTSKQQILKAAEELFARNGFGRTTLKDVARESGANTALVGYHFGNKDGLRQAVINRQLEVIRDELGPLWTASEWSHETVAELVDRLLNVSGNHKTFFCLHLWGMVDGGEQAEFMLTNVWEPIVKRLKQILLSLWHKGEGEVGMEMVLAAECQAHLIYGLLDHYATSTWHVFELGNLTDKRDFIECHKTRVKKLILQQLKYEPR